MLPGRCRAEAQAILAGTPARELELAGGLSLAGGVAGDVEGSAADLVEAARWLEATGDPDDAAHARRVLIRAKEHQRAYLQRLDEALEHPRSKENRAFTKRFYDLKGLRRAHEAARQLQAAITAALATGSSPDTFRRGQALASLVVEPLQEAIAAEQLDRVRVLYAAPFALAGDHSSAAVIADLPDEVIVRARRLRAAQAVLGEDEEDRMHLFFSMRGHGAPVLERDGTDEWQEAIAPRMVGDEEEALLEDSGVYGLGRWSDRKRSSIHLEHGVLDPVERADDVLARAAGLLRTPRRYERTSYGGPQPDLRGRLVRVEATAEAFREFAEAQADNPAFAGYALSRVEGRLELCARLTACRGMDDIEVRCVVPLGQNTRRTLPNIIKEARGHENWPADLIDESELTMVGSAEDAPLSRPFKLPRSERLRRAKVSLDDLLGADECAHPEGRWVAVGGSNYGSDTEPDGVALECPRCLRRRLAVVPLLAVPRHDQRLPTLEKFPDEGLLLRRERAYRILRGLPNLDDATLKEQLATQAPPSLDPGRWAVRRPTRLRDERRRSAGFGAS